MRAIKIKLGAVLHNCFVHPMLPFLPQETGAKLHEWSAKLWLAAENLNESSTTESFSEDEETEDYTDEYYGAD